MRTGHGRLFSNQRAEVAQTGNHGRVQKTQDRQALNAKQLDGKARILLKKYSGTFRFLIFFMFAH
jgi:hypothetical protein